MSCVRDVYSVSTSSLLDGLASELHLRSLSKGRVLVILCRSYAPFNPMCPEFGSEFFFSPFKDLIVFSQGSPIHLAGQLFSLHRRYWEVEQGLGQQLFITLNGRVSRASSPSPPCPHPPVSEQQQQLSSMLRYAVKSLETVVTAVSLQFLHVILVVSASVSHMFGSFMKHIYQTIQELSVLLFTRGEQ